jgi:alpha-galactosidase
MALPAQHPFAQVRRGMLLGAGAALLTAWLAAGCTEAGRRGLHQPPRAGTATQPAARSELPRDALWLETLDLAGIEQDWGRPVAVGTFDGHPLTMQGVVHPHGVGTHANSEWVIDLGGGARRFEAVVGVDDELPGRGSVVFVVRVDEREAVRTGILRGGDASQKLIVDLTGARRMTLLVEDAGDGIDADHADWASALLVRAPGATVLPTAVVYQEGPPPAIVPDWSPRPAIHAPRVTGATPGRPFLFRIPASGVRPMHFTAANLPAGLQLDADTGIISGALATDGNAAVALTVENAHGRAASTLLIVGRRNSLALTPPMGWNSWNVWGTAVDDAKVRAAADWLVASGLADHGFQYINIDDAWEAGRDGDGRILPNEKFPDMRALADYVHSKGLKLGIYSSPGAKTCGGYEGSWAHERLDAETYAAWGIDLLKYDWCAYEWFAQDHSDAELRKPYALMRDMLEAGGRDIVFSLCQYGMGCVWQWGADVGGNYWRTTGDITDTWASLSAIGFGQAGLEFYARPGHWNDPDMLVVGNVGWGPNLHPTGLRPNEQITHITLWALLAAPLLIGCDLADLDHFTLALLTNAEVLEINQDPLGRQARRVTEKDGLEVWARPLSDGTRAVGLFNRTRGAAPVTVAWRDLGLTGPQPVRDLWLRQDVGRLDSGFTATVPRHGAVMLKVGDVRK